MQMAVTTGASMISYLTGSKALAGVPGMLISGSRFIVAFPTGYITDKYGRKTGMYLSLVLGLIACLILSISSYYSLTFVMFCGFIVVGLGFGANTQLRVAAADMYPAKLRASGIEVSTEANEEEILQAEELIEGFNHFTLTKKPFITVK